MKPRYWKNPKPETVKKWIDNNKKLYSKEIKELDFIIKSSEKDEFVLSMYNALVSGRKITDKMLEAIHNIIKRNTPKELNKKLEWQKIVIPKLNNVREMIEVVEGGRIHTPYNRSYPFINSIIRQATKRSSLTKKQMMAVNNLYKRYKVKYDKKLEKNG
jgi:hypothetical protein|tara:strand:- start:1331 stop:1807 length:477 start_codon:yes stop_codon:yes gene_type:complete